MSDPLHIIVSLSPETIEALATAMRRPSVSRRDVFIGTSATTPESEPHSAQLFTYRQPYATEATRITEEDIGRIASALSEVTTRAVLEALGVPVERQDRGMEVRVGNALQRLGYRVVTRRSDGTRERVYQRTAPVVE